MPSADLAAAASALLGAPVVCERMLPGGTHARTALVATADRRLVVRRFPDGDDAAAREVRVLERIAALGAFVPSLVAHEGTLIVTTVVDGAAPAPDLAPETIAREMATALARVHALDGAGLPPGPKPLPSGDAPIARAARAHAPTMDDRVLSHNDFWCGNALWRGERLTGIVDWSDARSAPRGHDVAWCRQDLVLLGAPEAADTFLRAYESASGARIDDLRAWDLRVAAYADPVVETWAPNYLDLGRADGTAATLRARLDAWNSGLL